MDVCVCVVFGVEQVMTSPGLCPLPASRTLIITGSDGLALSSLSRGVCTTTAAGPLTS